MLAKTEPAALPAAVEPKRRTITLTNRAPVSITEDNWPIIAQGVCRDDYAEGCPWGWKISIYVRKEKIEQESNPYFRLPPVTPEYLIHAKYHAWDETDETPDTNVRVGRLLSTEQATDDLWKHILAVGDELRARLGAQSMWNTDEQRLRQKAWYERACKNVTHALDDCFANLPPHQMR